MKNRCQAFKSHSHKIFGKLWQIITFFLEFAKKKCLTPSPAPPPPLNKCITSTSVSINKSLIQQVSY